MHTQGDFEGLSVRGRSSTVEFVVSRLSLLSSAMVTRFIVTAKVIFPHVAMFEHLVVSPNEGPPKYIPKHYNPHYGDPEKGTPTFGKLPFVDCRVRMAGRG